MRLHYLRKYLSLNNNRHKPLFYDGDTLIYSKGNRVVYFSEDGDEKLIFKMPVSWLKYFFYLSRLLTRIFRLEVYSAAIHTNTYFISYLGKLYSYNKNTKALRVDFTFKKGQGPLSFCNTVGIKGFYDTIYFGEYFSDRNLDRIGIMKWDSICGWTECYVFEEGLINHIHSLIPDNKNNCVWILTGDHGPAAAIYRAQDDFSNVELIVSGKQKYRSCVAFPISAGLLYSTDSHLEKNSIRILSLINGEWLSTKFVDINGPVIYGCELQDYYVFSTSVEPGKEKTNFICTLLDRKKGPGILNNQVEIVAIEKVSMKIIKVETNPKDALPARLFQFGSAMFPGSSSHNNRLVIYYTATKNYEGQIKTIELDDAFES